MTRESDLLGQHLSARLTRSSLILQVDCQRHDATDATALLGDILHGWLVRDTQKLGIYPREFVRKSHEWTHSIHQLNHESASLSDRDRLLDRVWQLAFPRGGLGQPLFAQLGTRTLSVDAVFDFVARQLAHTPVSLIGLGVSHVALQSAIDAGAFSALTSLSKPSSTTSSTTTTPPQSYVGGDFLDPAPSRDGHVHYALAYPAPALSPTLKTDYFATQLIKLLLHPTPRLPHSSPKSLIITQRTQADHDVRLEVVSESYAEAGLLTIYLRAPTGDQVTTLAKATSAAIHTLAEQGITPALFQSALNQLKLDLLSPCCQDRLTKLDAIQTHLALGLDDGSDASLLQALDAVTPHHVQSVAKRMLHAQKCVASVGDVFGVPRSTEV